MKQNIKALLRDRWHMTWHLVFADFWFFLRFVFWQNPPRRSCYVLISWRNHPSPENAFSRRRLLQFSNFPVGIVPLDKRQPVSKRNIYQSSLAMPLLVRSTNSSTSGTDSSSATTTVPLPVGFQLPVLQLLLLLVLVASATVITTRASVGGEHLSVLSLTLHCCFNYCQESSIVVLLTSSYGWDHPPEV